MILREGGLWSDAKRVERQLTTVNIGYSHIKSRRMTRNVPIAARGTLGQYVPFYFCSRSVMLFVIHRGHEGYGGGQEEIVHLVTRARTAIATGRPWAFTDRHAELAHALYFDNLSKLPEVSWDVMERQYWSDVREERQAEFLVHEFFPWASILGVGVICEAMATRARIVLEQGLHQPKVVVRPAWYY